jgi:hypothetical protein
MHEHLTGRFSYYYESLFLYRNTLPLFFEREPRRRVFDVCLSLFIALKFVLAD